MAHNPKCQHSSCHKVANDYDQRFGQVIFFCNTTTQSHDPRIMDDNNRRDYNLDKIHIVCDECENTFTVDAFEEESLEEFECTECGHESKILVTTM